MSDIATPGPIDPSGQPDHRAEVSALKSWFRENLVSLALTAAAIGLVFVYLDPLDTLKVVIGLGLVIFIHELGHFLAAKWCDVHVKTFSIGFGPAVPFCSYKWGETTYMIGIIPLGGYVSMTGEGTGESMPDGADPDDDVDPRSFKNKSVGQRMLIISAGVVMNVILGMACFVAAYMHGVREEPATVGTVVNGSAAWRAGLRSGDEIVGIGSRDNPTFKDLRPIVMSTDKGEKVPVKVLRDGKELRFEVEPLREEGTYFPTLGVQTQTGLTLLAPGKRSAARPTIPGTSAALAADPGFAPGDRVVSLSDPKAYPAVTALPLVVDKNDPSRKQPDYHEFHRRMVLLAGKDVSVGVLRAGQPDDAAPTVVTVKPAYRSDLGVRMRMGEVVAVRKGSPADGVVVARDEDAGAKGAGDKIVQVSVVGKDGKRVWLTADGKPPEGAKPGDLVKPLDPVLLPAELDRWAAGFADADWPGPKVELVVLRVGDHTEKRVPLAVDYDPAHRFDVESVTLPNSPLSVSGLGLAYWVEGVVDGVEPGSAAATAKLQPGEAVGLQPGDVVTAVRFKLTDPAGGLKVGDWTDLKPHQWAFAEAEFQRYPPFNIDLKVKRGEETFETTLEGKPDANWPAADRGLQFQPDYRTQRAADMGDALNLGFRRTTRFIKEVYMNLYGMVFGRISPKTLSGPLTIATVSYKFAGEDFWQFLLFLGMISVNLAVVNFLPIPVLDGGHMVFLLYEKVTGRPLPERLFAAFMWLGLAMILILFAYVLTRDVRRVIFGWL